MVLLFVVKLKLNKGEVKMSVVNEIKKVFAPTKKQKAEDAETKQYELDMSDKFIKEREIRKIFKLCALDCGLTES